MVGAKTELEFRLSIAAIKVGQHTRIDSFFHDFGKSTKKTDRSVVL